MDYARISRIEKSKIYAEERQDRVTVESLQVSILGDNNGRHAVTYDDGKWTCDCNYFKNRQEVCSHIMAMERILADMVELA